MRLMRHLTNRKNASKLKKGFVPKYVKKNGQQRLVWLKNKVSDQYKAALEETAVIAYGLTQTPAGYYRLGTTRRRLEEQEINELRQDKVRRGYHWVYGSNMRGKWVKKSRSEHLRDQGYKKVNGEYVLTKDEISKRRNKMHFMNPSKLAAGYRATVDKQGKRMVWRKRASQRPKKMTSAERRQRAQQRAHNRLQQAINEGKVRAVTYGKPGNRKTRYVPVGEGSERQRVRAAKRKQQRLGSAEYARFRAERKLVRNPKTGQLRWVMNTAVRAQKKADLLKKAQQRRRAMRQKMMQELASRPLVNGATYQLNNKKYKVVCAWKRMRT